MKQYEGYRPRTTELSLTEENSGMCFLSHFPMPPSVNRLHRAVKGRVIKSAEYRSYENEVRTWMLTHQKELQKARDLCQKVSALKFVHIDTIFEFHKSAILTKENKPKRNDTSNRLKALHDVLAAILGIDDCYFWSGNFDKTVIPDSQREGVEITLVLAETEVTFDQKVTKTNSKVEFGTTH